MPKLRDCSRPGQASPSSLSRRPPFLCRPFPQATPRRPPVRLPASCDCTALLRACKLCSNGRCPARWSSLFAGEGRRALRAEGRERRRRAGRVVPRCPPPSMRLPCLLPSAWGPGCRLHVPSSVCAFALSAVCCLFSADGWPLIAGFASLRWRNPFGRRGPPFAAPPFRQTQCQSAALHDEPINRIKKGGQTKLNANRQHNNTNSNETTAIRYTSCREKQSQTK